MNTQRLLDLVKANEKSCDFDLGDWKHWCGTYGCLVGNHIISESNNEPDYQTVQMIDNLYGYGMGYEEVANYYGLTLLEAMFFVLVT